MSLLIHYLPMLGCVKLLTVAMHVGSGVSTVGPSGARAPLTYSQLNVIIK